ncbi:hypothetical protein DAEQUDRAFT_329048 [Daedalea quercina L-15889]|uniref:F-box domain-containing protein n=1 Tax=Daedalea quercina L-15889 TaxID=1314783 RepID=A0A165PQA8_9APHY|nr:hypothetical protein DAEQUDRAFT_329048 [Daedalea quercina L-15889]
MFDTEALREGFRKMNFPLLAKLHITYLPPLETPYDLPLLPRHESIFREPRMLHLTHLKLAHFTLDVDEGKTMLRYMPALTQLTFVDCIRVGAIICALSGGTCDNRHENPASVWICPRLELLRIVDSPDLKFSCLQGLVRSRYQSSVTPISCPSTSSKAAATITSNSPRLVKPLRRRLRDVDTTQDPASSSASRTGPKITASWSPYAVVRPSQLQSVSVEGCRRVSELEAVSLTYEFPSLRVKWEA